MPATLDPWSLAADLVDPPAGAAAFELLGYEPNCLPREAARERGDQVLPEPCGLCPQELFHLIDPFSDGGPWDVLFGGAMGGGKTEALLLDALANAYRYPGIEIWFIRSTYTELTRDVVPRLARYRNAAAIGGRWNGGDYTLHLHNGSMVRFIHAPNVAAAAAVRGECQALYVDERTLIDPEAIDTLVLRIRTGDATLPIVGIRSGSNPGGIGHGRAKADFYDPAPLGKKLIEIIGNDGHPVRSKRTGRCRHRYFLPSLAKDNPKLNEEYTDVFQQMSAEARAAYELGDWAQFEGMRFKALASRIRAVEELPEIPLGGIKRGLGIDWGMAAPFAAVWAAIVNEQVIIYRELHVKELTATEQAEMILAHEAEGERLPQRPIPTWIDPATWARDTRKPLAKPISADAPPPGSIADLYRKAGVPVDKAFNDRIAGWGIIDELLGTLPDGRPRLVISEACPNVIRSLSNAPRSKVNPEDVDEKYADDHAADAARYLLAGLCRHGGRRRGRGTGSGGVSGGPAGGPILGS